MLTVYPLWRVVGKAHGRMSNSDPWIFLADVDSFVAAPVLETARRFALEYVNDKYHYDGKWMRVYFDPKITRQPEVVLVGS